MDFFFFSAVHGSFVFLVCLLPPQCKHMQVTAGQLCLCVCCCACHGDAECLHISVLQVGSDLLSFCSVVILTSGSRHSFFLLPLLTAILHLCQSYWCASTPGADNHGGPGIETVGAWPPPWVEWDKQVRQCLSAVLLPGPWGWECREKCRITNLYLQAFTSERLGL